MQTGFDVLCFAFTHPCSMHSNKTVNSTSVGKLSYFGDPFNSASGGVVPGTAFCHTACDGDSTNERRAPLSQPTGPVYQLSVL